MSTHRLACLWLLLFTPGCSFDPSSLTGAPGETPDARPVADAMPGAADARADANQAGCENGELTLALRIDGTPVTGAPGPYVEALVGDLVEISAEGSCGGDGALSYEWTLMPDEGTAQPALADKPAAFTVYPTTAGDYRVALTVRDAAGVTVDASAIAIRAHAWQVAEAPAALSMGLVKDLSVGDGNLWIASQGGAFSTPLASAPEVFTLVEVAGDQVPNDLAAVLFDDRTKFLWFGHAGDMPGPWRLDMAMSPPLSDQIRWDDEDALDGTAQTRDFTAFSTNTILAATSRGITAVDGSESEFSDRIRPDGQSPIALAGTGNRRLAGSVRLYDLPDGPTYDLGVGGADNKIRALAIDAANEELWAGTDGNGVVAFNLRTNATRMFYIESNSDLGSNKIRALAVETAGPHAGDVWAATDKGVSRYIRQRDTWIHMDAGHGLTGHLDIATLAIDPDPDRRGIYGGSDEAVVYIREP